MASSSSSSITYDVFVSLRFKEVGNTFCSHLYAALDRRKIKTFMAGEELEKEDKIAPSTLRAIKSSKIFLIIFSNNYAFSTRCLDELVEILKCKKIMEEPTVIPVFYCIDPFNVRKQTGSFGAAFDDHERNFKNKVESWRLALTEAGNLSGWDSSKIRPDSVLVETISEETLKKLNVASSRISNGSIGLDSRIKKVMSSLCIDKMPDFHMVGIWGMGGIGKTTIVDAIYNQISSHFEGACFLHNVRETAVKGDLLHLRQKLFSKLLNEQVSDEGALTIGSSSFISHRLQNKRVLVVLDDVNDPEQVNILFGGIDPLGGSGSRVIITTRDRQVLNSLDIEAVYKVQKLAHDEAFKLFCQHAFKDQPSEDFVDLSNKVVRYAKGVPLALKVLGLSLRGRDRKYWVDALKKLRNVPDSRILNVLKISYDGLDPETREIFLDTAFFLTGDSRDVVTRVLDDGDKYSCIDSLITDLVDRSLITISKSGKIKMHDSLKEMAWYIARHESKNPKKRKRLCCVEDVCNLLRGNEGSEMIRGISIDLSGMNKLSINPNAFVNMPNLKFLKINGHASELPCDLQFLPNELRYLSWTGYSLKSLPSAFCTERLVKLRIRKSNVEQLWSGTRNLVSLKELDLAYCKNLKEIPDLSHAINLESINFFKCESLAEIPSSIEHLNKLKSLGLCGCKNLRKLPVNICKLNSLEQLFLDGCSELETFPDILETMESLEVLNLSNAATKGLPTSIKLLVRLKRLGWTKFGNQIPDPMALSVSLSADLRVVEIPQGIGCLCLLEYLDLSGHDFESIPASIEQLCRLKELKLNYCLRLQSLPELPANLERLDAHQCSSLKLLYNRPFFKARLSGQYIFTDCFKLNTQLIIPQLALEYNQIFQQQEKQDVEGKFLVSLPGSEVPEWFHHRSRASTVIIDPIGSNFFSLVLCFVIASDCKSDELFDEFEIVYSKTKPLLSCWQYKSYAEHMILLYLRETNYSIWEKLSVEELIIEFGIRPIFQSRINVKSCGVHVLEGNPKITFKEQVPDAKRLKRTIQ